MIRRMNVNMKATKKIVGAACALVAAVALSAGSTFAWFASNSSVSATNMKVQAQVPTNIYIEYGYKATATEVEKTTLDFTSEEADTERHQDPAELTPAVVSIAAEEGGTVTEGNDGGKTGKPVTGGALYLYTAPDVTETGKWDEAPEEGKPGTPKELVEVATSSAGSTSFSWTDSEATNTDYIATFNMTVANKSLATDIQAKVNVTASNDGTCLFVRTGMLVGMQTAAGQDMTYKFYSIANESEGGTALTKTGGELDYGTILPAMPRNTVATITFLVWFDGQDTDCTVNNASSLGAITFSIDFTIPSGD